jgi:hypothetical protein
VCDAADDGLGSHGAVTVCGLRWEYSIGRMQARASTLGICEQPVDIGSKHVCKDAALCYGAGLSKKSRNDHAHLAAVTRTVQTSLGSVPASCSQCSAIRLPYIHTSASVLGAKAPSKRQQCLQSPQLILCPSLCPSCCTQGHSSGPTSAQCVYNTQPPPGSRSRVQHRGLAARWLAAQQQQFSAVLWRPCCCSAAQLQLRRRLESGGGGEPPST